jgi:hypothetical protein
MKITKIYQKLNAGMLCVFAHIQEMQHYASRSIYHICFVIFSMVNRISADVNYLVRVMMCTSNRTQEYASLWPSDGR